MFKKLMYDKVVTQLNSGDTLFKGGYLIGLDRQGIPYVVDSSTLSSFDYERKIVIPVSEEYFTETPSVHTADRSDYVAQYQIMFQTSRETEVMTVMDNFRNYFFANKQFTLDGYNVSIKTTRGEKQPAVPVDSGNFYVRFKINVYLTAIKNGLIWADTDTWSIRSRNVINSISINEGSIYEILTVGTTDFTAIGASENTIGVIFTATGVGIGTGTVYYNYDTLRLNTETTATVGITTPSTKGAKVVNLIANTNINSKISFFYNATIAEELVYEWVMNKLDRNTLFDIKHVFQGETFNYIGLISGGARTRTDNGVIIIEFDWIEADI